MSGRARRSCVFVRGRAWSCAAVVRGRAWSCAAAVRGRAWSCAVVRGPSCVVVLGHAWSYVVVRGSAWSCVVVTHCRDARTDGHTDGRTTYNTPLGWGGSIFFILLRWEYLSALACQIWARSEGRLEKTAF